MAGLIEKNAREEFTLLQRVKIVDSEPVFESIQVKGFFTAFNSNDFAQFGVTHNGKNFYISPTIENITLPCKIEYNNKQYDIKMITPFYNLKGVHLGFKLTGVGG